jgi:purine-nucleoside phosphorylase
LKINLAKIKVISEYLETKLIKSPKFSITSGSGFSDIWNDFEIIQTIPYSDIPEMPMIQVSGHRNELFLINYFGTPGIIFGGRFHIYEGHPLESILIPILVPINLKVNDFILMNAAGGLNSNFEVGDLMILNDAVNFTYRNINPILSEEAIAPHPASLIFDQDWIQILENNLINMKLKYQKGTYICVTGPSYETAAEIRMFRRLGGDAMGMSTVLESQAASLFGANIIAFSVITNILKEVNTNKISHSEVISILEKSKKNAEQLIRAALDAKFNN